jgi:hypothetical protein
MASITFGRLRYRSNACHGIGYPWAACRPACRAACTQCAARHNGPPAPHACVLMHGSAFWVGTRFRQIPLGISGGIWRGLDQFSPELAFSGVFSVNIFAWLAPPATGHGTTGHTPINVTIINRRWPLAGRRNSA